jgi:C-terminal processing protease CtpA/Prc
MDEKMWLRSWTNDLYLWYEEVQDVDPTTFGTVLDYFDSQMTQAITPSGAAKDKFHSTIATDEWLAMSQSGEAAGYGAQWAVLATTPPRRVLVAYTQPDSPAVPTSGAPLLLRGTEILTVDGVDLVNAGDQASVDRLNAGLFPSAAGEMHSFQVQDAGSAVIRNITMTSAIVTEAPVQNVAVFQEPGGPVGYMLFNDHIATAEDALLNAVTTLQAGAITDLVLDIRYNEGGFLDVASELAFMIAGPGRTTGKTFELLSFNNKHTTRDPVTGQLITPQPFHDTTVGLPGAGPAGRALPSLNLSRVFVLTSSSTCSASESIINSLRGVDVEVIQIGSTTCGKPYGFYPQDNCGTTYFSIEFKGVNDKGFGEYPDGFSPINTLSVGGERIPGCSVADDFDHQLGDTAEARFAAALTYRQSASCPAPSGFGPRALAATMPSHDAQLFKSPWLENRILRR